MKLCIIIVNWNTRELLESCLNSISRNNPRAETLGTIVVDNASSDGSAEMIREKFPQVKLMRNKENVGFAKANNQAIRDSSSEYLLLLNPDTELQEGALGNMLGVLEADCQIGAVGARLLNFDGSLQHSCHPRPTLLREFWRLFHLDVVRPISVYKMSEWNLAEPRPVDVLDGACLMLRRKAIKQVGHLDERFFIYSEEVDLCDRMRKVGWKIYWVPKAQVLHFGGQSTQQVSSEMFIRLYQAKIQYFRKYYGLAGSRIYKFILGAASLARQLLVPMGTLRSGPLASQDLAVARSYRQLLKKLPSL